MIDAISERTHRLNKIIDRKVRQIHAKKATMAINEAFFQVSIVINSDDE